MLAMRKPARGPIKSNRGVAELSCVVPACCHPAARHPKDRPVELLGPRPRLRMPLLVSAGGRRGDVSFRACNERILDCRHPDPRQCRATPPEIPPLPLGGYGLHTSRRRLDPFPRPLRAGVRGRGLRAPARQKSEIRTSSGLAAISAMAAPIVSIEVAGLFARLPARDPAPLTPARKGRGHRVSTRRVHAKQKERPAPAGRTTAAGTAWPVSRQANSTNLSTAARS
jgi:hypothetical protein